MASTPDLVNILDRYVFDEIWNAIYAEYRVNVKLKIINNTYTVARATDGKIQVTLPTTNEAYFVAYATYPSFRGGIKIPTNEWVNIDQLLEDTNTMVYLYSLQGRLIPREFIYLYKTKGNRLFVAVKRSVFVKCIESDFSDIYLTVYRDSDQDNDITVKAWEFTSANRGAISAYLTSCRNKNNEGTILYINGIETNSNLSIPSNIRSGDVVEVVCDDNVTGMFEVNVSDTTTGYTSTKYLSSRDIIHCPKSLNPDNYLVTLNTLMITVVTTSGAGYYLHRTYDENTLAQITHNDISVKSDVLDSYRTMLKDQNIMLRVRVRFHNKTNPLISEYYHMSLLYNQSDDDILKHLRGLERPVDLGFWKAENLESSFYTELMFENNYDDTTGNRFSDYVTGLGYYAVANVLSSHVFHTTVEIGARTVNVIKPTLFQNIDVVPLIYINGLLTDPGFNKTYEFINGRDNVYIVFNDNIVFNKVTNISVVLLEGSQENTPYRFVPTTGFPYIDVPFRNIEIYQQAVTANPTDFVPAGSTIYQKLELPHSNIIITIVDGKTRVTASSDLLGETLFIYAKDNVYINNYRIPTDSGDNLDSFHFIKAKDTDLRIVNDLKPDIPMIGVDIYDVYVNGRKCIEGLDLITPMVIRDGDGHAYRVSTNPISLSYIDTSLPYQDITVVGYSGSQITNEAHYTFQGKASYDNSVSIWIPNMGKLFVRGKIINDPISENNYFDYGDTTSSTGDPYQVLVTLPASVSKAMEGFTQTNELARLSAIQNYLKSIEPVDKSLIILNTKYQVFSPTVNMLLKHAIDEEGYLLGRFATDPDPVLQKLQFINTNEDIKFASRQDHTLEENTEIFSREYLDILVAYKIRSASIAEVNFADSILSVMLKDDPNARGNFF